MKGITDVEPTAAVELPAGARPDGARLARLGLIAAMVSRLAGRLVGVVLVVVLAREADHSTVAVYGYLLGTATLVTVLTDLGVASVAGREVAAGRMPADGALHAALLPQVGSALVAGAVTVVLAVVGPEAAPPAAIGLTVAFVVVGAMNNLWADVLRGTGRVVVEGALQLGSAVALVAAGTLVITLGGDATDLLIVVVLKEVAVLVVAALTVRPRRRPEVRSRTLLGQSLWVALAGTAVVVLWREGTIVVGAAGSLSALATYVVATRFFDAGVTVAHTAGFGLGPGLSALADDPAAFRHAARKYLGLVTLLGAIVAVVGALAAGPLTTIPFGERWHEAVPAVRVIAVSGLPILVSYVCMSLLSARRQVRWLSLAAVIGSLVGVGTTILLTIRHPEAISGAIGTTVGATVLAALLLFGLRDLLRPLGPSLSD
jgi:O-antigen/teichoic acid export membrane protein